MAKKPFWDNKYGRDAICAITLTRLRPGKNKEGESYVIHLKGCKHSFYRSAFYEWEKDHDTCPVCRAEL